MQQPTGHSLTTLRKMIRSRQNKITCYSIAASPHFWWNISILFPCRRSSEAWYKNQGGNGPFYFFGQGFAPLCFHPCHQNYMVETLFLILLICLRCPGRCWKVLTCEVTGHTIRIRTSRFHVNRGSSLLAIPIQKKKKDVCWNWFFEKKALFWNRFLLKKQNLWFRWGDNSLT